MGFAELKADPEGMLLEGPPCGMISGVYLGGVIPEGCPQGVISEGYLDRVIFEGCLGEDAPPELSSWGYASGLPPWGYSLVQEGSSLIPFPTLEVGKPQGHS